MCCRRARKGWGLAVTEAAQHGVPTIGYRSSGGLTDSIVDGVTGLLVDDHDEMVVGTRAAADRSGAARSARRQGAGPQRRVLLAAERRRDARGAGVDARGQAGQRHCLTRPVRGGDRRTIPRWRRRSTLTCPRERSLSCSPTSRGRQSCGRPTARRWGRRSRRHDHIIADAVTAPSWNAAQAEGRRGQHLRRLRAGERRRCGGDRVPAGGRFCRLAGGRRAPGPDRHPHRRGGASRWRLLRPHCQSDGTAAGHRPRRSDRNVPACRGSRPRPAVRWDRSQRSGCAPPAGSGTTRDSVRSCASGAGVDVSAASFHGRVSGQPSCPADELRGSRSRNEVDSKGFQLIEVDNPDRYRWRWQDAAGRPDRRRTADGVSARSMAVRTRCRFGPSIDVRNVGCRHGHGARYRSPTR